MRHRFAVPAAAIALLLFAVSASAWVGDSFDGDHGSAHIRIGRNFDLPPGGILSEPLIIVGGSATLNGTVERSVTVVGGRIEVGPTAVVRGDLKTIGGAIDIDRAAQITGHVEENVRRWGRGGGGGGIPSGRWWSWLALVGTGLRLALVFLIGLAFTVAAPGVARAGRSRVEASPGGAMLSGLAAEVLCVPVSVAVAVVLVISILGIPLLPLIPLIFAAFLLVGVAGFAVVATRVGGWALAAIGVSKAPAAESATAVEPRPSLSEFAVGCLLLMGLTVVAHLLAVGPLSIAPLARALGVVGAAIEWAAWTIGLGAMLHAWRHSPTPPPVPPPIPPPMSPPPIPEMAPVHP